jgi:hypothetical protein
MLSSILTISRFCIHENNKNSIVYSGFVSMPCYHFWETIQLNLECNTLKFIEQVPLVSVLLVYI